MEFSIGDVFEVTETYKGKSVLLNEEVTILKGEKIIIGADKLAHHISSGMISPIGKDSTVEGYNAEGIAKYICLFLRSHLAFDIDEMLEGYDFTMNELADEILNK